MRNGSEEITAGNSTFAIGGVPSPFDAFVAKGSLWLRLKFNVKSRPSQICQPLPDTAFLK
jgi:hypothetical protein